MAIVKSINTSEQVGTMKQPVPEANFLEGKGIEGDAHCGLHEIRQISLLADESAQKIRDMGVSVGPGSFAENLTTEGIALRTLPIGTKLKIGQTIQEVSKLGKECHAGCAIKQQAGECVMPTEGIFTRILKGGIVQVGDEISILE